MGRPASGYAATRQRLVEISRETIAERGLDQVALADIAAKADVTVPTLYHYFRDREELVLEVLRAEVTQLLDAVTVSGAFADTPQTRLRVFLEKQADYLERARPATIALVLRSLLDSRSTEARAVASTALGHAERLFGEVVSQLLPGAAPADAQAVTDLLRASLAGLFLMRAVDADVDAGVVAGRLLTVVESIGFSNQP